MTFTRRPKEESPIYRNMLREALASGDERALAAAEVYGAKVDAFNETGEVSMTRLGYEGPDLSPGADRPNSMKGIFRTQFDAQGERKGFGTPPPEESVGLRGRTTVTPIQWRGKDRLAIDNT